MSHSPAERLSTGVEGLDEILDGGLVPRRSYLVRGPAGSGKTTLGFHFLAAGLRAGESCLLITLGEPERRLRENAARFGIDLGGLAVLDLSPTPESFSEAVSYDIFTPADVEREPTTRRIVEEVERVRPGRVFLDGITQFRFLVGDDAQFHRQTVSFLRYLVERDVTVLFTSEPSRSVSDDDLRFLCDGVIRLGSRGDRRSASVQKFRGSDFRPGRHALRITAAGLRVFPKLVPGPSAAAPIETVSSGVAELDGVLHGGLERGTVTFVTGPTGVGKSTLALEFVKAAVGRGEPCAIYSFEETSSVMTARCGAVGVPLGPLEERGLLRVSPVAPRQYYSDEFSIAVRGDVEERGTRVVVIDSVAGHRGSLDGDDLAADLHALCVHLKERGVLVILVNDVKRVNGPFRPTESGLSYLADTIVFLRYLERRSEEGVVTLGKCLGVLKKRLGDFEKTLRPFEITARGVRVGPPMARLGGILSAMPKVVVSDEGGGEDD